MSACDAEYWKCRHEYRSRMTEPPTLQRRSATSLVSIHGWLTPAALGRRRGCYCRCAFHTREYAGHPTAGSRQPLLVRDAHSAKSARYAMHTRTSAGAAGVSPPWYRETRCNGDSLLRTDYLCSARSVGAPRLAHASRSWSERVGCTKAMVTARALPFARQRSHSQFVSPQTRNQPRLTRLHKVSAALAATLLLASEQGRAPDLLPRDARAPFFAPASFILTSGQYSITGHTCTVFRTCR